MPISSDARMAVLREIEKFEQERNVITKRLQDMNEKRDRLQAVRANLNDRIAALRSDLNG